MIGALKPCPALGSVGSICNEKTSSRSRKPSQSFKYTSLSALVGMGSTWDMTALTRDTLDINLNTPAYQAQLSPIRLESTCGKRASVYSLGRRVDLRFLMKWLGSQERESLNPESSDQEPWSSRRCPPLLFPQSSRRSQARDSGHILLPKGTLQPPTQTTLSVAQSQEDTLHRVRCQAIVLCDLLAC